MRLFSVLASLIVLLVSCNKESFTTAPQISFVKLSPNNFSSDLSIQFRDYAPKLTIKVTDAEGDLGCDYRTDTSYVFVKNLSSNFLDSLAFPYLNNAAGKNFSAEVSVNLYDCLDCVAVRPYLDTAYFEVYVTDFAGNKSNVITTSGHPVFYQCL